MGRVIRFGKIRRRRRVAWRPSRPTAFFLGLGALWLVFELAVALPGSPAKEIAGRASVIDGDTLRIGGHDIRLHGIDAPEKRQVCLDWKERGYSCGRRAAQALEHRIGYGPVVCRVRDRDRYGRQVAVCRSGEADLGAWMVRQGHAVAYLDYSLRYVPEELLARTDGAGIWQGDFDWPWDWRRGARR